MGRSLKSLKQGRGGNKGKAGVFPARVQAVILNDEDYPDLFKRKDEWASIGSILFSQLQSPSKGKINFENLDKARPIFPHQKMFPVENELVFVVALPSLGIQSNVSSIEYWYFSPLNSWGSVNHNSIPDPLSQMIQAAGSSMGQSYQSIETGTPNRIQPNGEEISLGPTFIQKNNIKSLQPYQGDIFYEGRWGQSLRFGSTVKDGKPKNDWSEEGDDGDPITLIRNGQYDDGRDSWVPQNENINEDSSSIYLTSTQKIPIKTTNNEFSSYNSSPDKPDEYKESQVIINSNRLVFNAKTDSVLISGEKSVFLGGNGSLNFTAGENVVIECDDIKLGSKNATEPVILGDKFLNDLNKLLKELQKFGTAVGSAPIMIAPFTPSAAHQSSCIAISIQAAQMIGKIETYKSKISKTK